MKVNKLKNKIFRRLKLEIDNVSTIYPENQKIHSSVNTSGAEIYGNIEIGENTKFFGSGIMLNGNIKIGRYTSLNGPNLSILSSINPITIGNFCSIARNTDIQEYNHNYNRITSYFIHRNLFLEKNNEEISSGPITIGHDVWIGTGCKILSGVTIGNGAVVGANAVVTKDIPAYAIVGGNSAKVIKYRFSQEIISILEEIAWWNWPIEKIKQYKWLFEKDLTKEMIEKLKDKNT
jgi:virginiamycin A acetyltransferase